MLFWSLVLLFPTIESLCNENHGCSEFDLEQLTLSNLLNESSCLKFDETSLSVRQTVSLLNKTPHYCPLVNDNLKTSLFVNKLRIRSVDGQKLLTVNWRFESDLNFIEYLIQVGKSTGAPTHCKLYQIKQHRLPTTKSFVDSCVLILERSSSYIVNVTNHVYGHTKTYTVFTPDNLNKVVTSSSADEWRTILAVAADDKRLEVKFIPSTDHAYKIEVKSSRGSQVLLEKTQHLTIQPNQTEAVFNRSGDTRFSITITYCSDTAACKIIHTTGYFKPHFNIMDNSVSTSDDPSVSVAGVDDGITLRREHVIIIATIGAVLVVAAIAVGIFILCYRRRNQHTSVEDYHMSHLQHGDGFTGSFLLEEENKDSAPTVLILYSYDHQAHLSAVQSLALLLQNALGCLVLTDFWAGQEISERGVMFWLEQILQTVDFVIVVCSSGVRFKSCSSRNHNLYQDTEDSYLLAMKLLQSSSPVNKDSQQHIVVYFNYCSEWDIPAALEEWPRYKLPDHSENFMSLFDDDKKSDTQEEYKNCCIQTLKDKMVEADKYVTENPNWFHLHIEPEQANTSPETHVQVKGSGNSLSRHKFKTISDLSVQELNKQVVTVEYNISCTDLADSDYESGPSTKRSAPTLSKLTKSNGSFHENGTSFSCLNTSPSSSMEDLEKDIKFMLNPTIKHKYHSTPGYMMNLGSSPLPLSLGNISNIDSLLPLPECVEQPDVMRTTNTTDSQTPAVTFNVLSDSTQMDCDSV